MPKRQSGRSRCWQVTAWPGAWLLRCYAFLLLVRLANAHSDSELQTVRLQLKWRHQFQFAGYYAAVHKGFYHQAKLKVEIQEARPGLNPVDSVLKGQCDFGVYGTELVRYRAAGIPVVALAAVFQHSPALLVSRRDQQIQQIRDLAGKLIYMEPDNADLQALLSSHGLETNHYLNPYSPDSHDFSVDRLLRGEVDAMFVYTSDLFSLTNAGLPYLVFSPREAGIDFYGDILFTTERTVTADPQVVRAFREATIRGWEYAMAHPGEMIQLIRDHYCPGREVGQLEFEAMALRSEVAADFIEPGYMSPARWQTIIDTYARLGLLRGEVDLDRFIYDPEPQGLSAAYVRHMIATAVLAGIAIAAALRYRKLGRQLAAENRKRQHTEAALRKQVDDHRRVAESVEALANLGLKLSAVHTAKEAAEIIMGVADRVFGWDSCRLDLYSRENNRLYQILIKDSLDGQRVEFPSTYKHHHPPPLTQQVINHGAKLILRDPKTFLPGATPFGDELRPSASLMFVPIRNGAEVRGIATIQSYTPDAYTQEDLASFQALADHCGGALERLRVQDEREQLIQQLQGALAQVRTLRGLLPICAQCKKIRDDHGYWNQVEVYVRDHSHANFTHSICPDCARHLYPEICDDAEA